MASILEFIKNGNLDFISLGVTKENIENKLGKPDDMSVSRKPVILKYGSMQLSFNWDKSKNEAILCSIHLYFDDDIIFPKELCLQGWIPDMQTGQKELLKQVIEQNIALDEDKRLSFDNSQKAYKSSANVTVIFDIENNNDRLASIHLAK